MPHSPPAPHARNKPQNFLPSPPHNDVDFCSGDCRFSCSIMRHTKDKNQKTHKTDKK